MHVRGLQNMLTLSLLAASPVTPALSSFLPVFNTEEEVKASGNNTQRVLILIRQ